MTYRQVMLEVLLVVLVESFIRTQLKGLADFAGVLQLVKRFLALPICQSQKCLDVGSASLTLGQDVAALHAKSVSVFAIAFGTDVGTGQEVQKHQSDERIEVEQCSALSPTLVPVGAVIADTMA